MAFVQFVAQKHDVWVDRSNVTTKDILHPNHPDRVHVGRCDCGWVREFHDMHTLARCADDHVRHHNNQRWGPFEFRPVLVLPASIDTRAYWGCRTLGAVE